VAGYFWLAGTICSFIPFVPTAACVFGALAAGVVVGNAISAAYNHTDLLPAWWCAPGQWLCSPISAPGAWWDPFAYGGLGQWYVPMQVRGTALEFSWAGILIGEGMI
jgi:hypothetical protein